MSIFSAIAVKRILIGLGSIAALGLGFDYVVTKAQRRPPRFMSSDELTDAPGDREAMDQVARLTSVGLVDRGTPSLPVEERLVYALEGGAEAIELSHVDDELDFKTLLHSSPVVRSYAAIDLTRRAPSKIGRLRMLLGDSASVAVAAYDDQPEHRTVGQLVVGLLCARKDSAKARILLERAASDWTLLGVRAEARRCFKI